MNYTLLVQLVLLWSATLMLTKGVQDSNNEEAGSGQTDPTEKLYSTVNNRLESIESQLATLESQKCGCPNQGSADLAESLKDLRNELLKVVEQRLQEFEENITLQVQRLQHDTSTQLINAAQLVPRTTPVIEPIIVPVKVPKLGFPDTSVTPANVPLIAPIHAPLLATRQQLVFNSCQQVAAHGLQSDIYKLNIDSVILEGFCEISPSREAWLLIQRHKYGDVNFYRGWNEYKNGFGSSAGDFWLGNHKLYDLTNRRDYVLFIELEDLKGNKGYASYQKFRVSDESSGYRLSYSSYSGTSGDALKSSNGARFSTYDMDQDESIIYNCAELLQGGFWYSKCGNANLNGVLKVSNPSLRWRGVTWNTWDNDVKVLRKSVMKIKPIN